MPELNGLELARILRINPDILIIFVSNMEEYVYEALKLHPFAFIRKSNIENDMPFFVKDIIMEYGRRKRENDVSISIESNNKIYNFNPYKVIYVEIHCKIITFYERNNSYEIPYKLSKLLTVLEPYNFIQINRGLAVNCLYIFTVEREAVVLDNGERLPLSKSREDEARRKFCENAGN